MPAFSLVLETAKKQPGSSNLLENKHWERYVLNLLAALGSPQQQLCSSIYGWDMVRPLTPIMQWSLPTPRHERHASDSGKALRTGRRPNRQDLREEGG